MPRDGLDVNNHRETSSLLRGQVEKGYLTLGISAMDTRSKQEMTRLLAFNSCLLELGRLARTRGGSHFMQEGLQAFRQVVPFASAWWGEMSTSALDVPPQTWMHGRIDLPESFAGEWHKGAGSDSFSRDTLSQPGKVICESGFTDPCAQVDAFARRHDLFHVMCISFELPESGLMFFVCLYRGSSAAAFCAMERSLFSAFCEHLLQLWRFQVQDLIRFDSQDGLSDFAVARLDGSLHYVGARLCAVIEREFPGWSGSVLPAQVSRQLQQAPSVIRLGRSVLTLSPHAEHVILSLAAPSRASVLAPRERTVALLFAAGHSYKEIARILVLSPATVRTYLRNSYLQLGVKSKVELGAALGLNPAVAVSSP